VDEDEKHRRRVGVAEASCLLEMGVDLDAHQMDEVVAVGQVGVGQLGKKVFGASVRTSFADAVSVDHGL